MPRRSGNGSGGATAPVGQDEIMAVIEGVRRLQRGLRLAARTVERETGLSAAQLFVLEHLVESPGASLNELAGRTMTDRSSVSVVVDRLVDSGLASRTTSKEDRRRSEIRITAAGRKVLERAPTPPTDLLIAALKTLPPTTVERLGKSLGQLNSALGFEESEMLFEGS